MIIIIPGRPVPAVRMTQKDKWKPRAKKYLEYREKIGWAALIICHSPTSKDIGVSVKVYLSGKKTRMGNDGDVDNYLKSALDGLNGIAWEDDRQVIRAVVEKIPCKSKDEEKMEILIKEVNYNSRVFI